MILLHNGIMYSRPPAEHASVIILAGETVDVQNLHKKKTIHNVYTIYVWGRIRIHLNRFPTKFHTKVTLFRSTETGNRTRNPPFVHVKSAYVYTVLRGFYHTGFEPPFEDSNTPPKIFDGLLFLARHLNDS